jgi:hypothetical protein
MTLESLGLKDSRRDRTRPFRNLDFITDLETLRGKKKAPPEGGAFPNFSNCACIEL